MDLCTKSLSDSMHIGLVSYLFGDWIVINSHMPPYFLLLDQVWEEVSLTPYFVWYLLMAFPDKEFRIILHSHASRTTFNLEDFRLVQYPTQDRWWCPGLICDIDFLIEEQLDSKSLFSIDQTFHIYLLDRFNIPFCLTLYSITNRYQISPRGRLRPLQLWILYNTPRWHLNQDQ